MNLRCNNGDFCETNCPTTVISFSLELHCCMLPVECSLSHRPESSLSSEKLRLCYPKLKIFMWLPCRPFDELPIGTNQWETEDSAYMMTLDLT